MNDAQMTLKRDHTFRVEAVDDIDNIYDEGKNMVDAFERESNLGLSHASDQDSVNNSRFKINK